MIHEFARMAKTAVGQDMDASAADGEEFYWRTVAMKSTPYYSCGLTLGAIAGNAPKLRDALFSFGVAIGQAIQVADDFADVMASPAAPDWTGGNRNLVLLYGRLGNYPDKERFLSLLPHAVENPDALKEAQEILVQEPLDYCQYVLETKLTEATRLVESAGFVDTAPLLDMVKRIGKMLEL